MPSDHPQTPESPSQSSFGPSDLPRKPITSPQFTNSLPTPAHSINGSMSSLEPQIVETNTRDEPSNKRKRHVEDHGDRDQKKAHVEDSRLSIEDLHLDVGEKYLLCRTPHPGQTPSLSQDLFDRYSLESIAKSVARQKPNGEKNALRKTYKNFFKALELSGDPQVDKKEVNAPGTLSAMLAQPDEQWDSEMVRGHEMDKGLSEAVNTSIGKALTMARGKIPKAAWNPAILGEVAAPSQLPEPAKGLHSGNRTPIPHAAAAARAGKADIPRPKRNVKKRSYGDASYEGYGEGYVDDDNNHDVGYSTGDGEDRSGRKRPKKLTTPKKTGPHSFQGPSGPMRQNSYGPGMVGV
ncbi:Mediator of RNA polymerase II transcription subunit 19 [Lachnellula cervina]|uniref:Mediator of RNA polymerase II transcription subunit 19 n=1 Tax=Lachnellula cervina TaxID=1316786 RepID=A0A7D8UW03_9HELO|nr:Mediator of RNA polymerase II transcription subunit 19 [Lachnellula cervina]